MPHVQANHIVRKQTIQKNHDLRPKLWYQEAETEKRRQHMKRMFHIRTLMVSFATVLLISVNSYGSGACIKGDCKNGQGTYLRADGSRYVGEWKNGKKNGHGTLTRPGGSKYVGEWKNDEPHGRGIWFFENGGKYEGQWFRSKFHGYGVYIYANGSKYEGEFIHGSPTQNGTWTYPKHLLEQQAKSRGSSAGK